MREREKTKPADLPSLPCPLFYIHSIWYVSASGSLVLFLLALPMSHAYIRILIVFFVCLFVFYEKRHSLNFFVYEGTEKEISRCAFVWSLCVRICAAVTEKGVCVCESVSVTQACRALTWRVAFLTSTALTSLLFSASLT